MASRPLIAPFHVMINGDMSANSVSKVTILQNLSMISYQVSWTGTSPVGTISIEASNDYAQNSDGSVKNSGTWDTLTLSVGGNPASSIAITGNSGSGLIDITQTAAYAIRLKYTFTSGVGTMQAYMTAKVQ